MKLTEEQIQIAYANVHGCRAQSDDVEFAREIERLVLTKEPTMFIDIESYDLHGASRVCYAPPGYGNDRLPGRYACYLIAEYSL